MNFATGKKRMASAALAAVLALAVAGFETLEDMNAVCIDGYSGMYAVESNVTEA